MSSNINQEKKQDRLNHLFNAITDTNYYTSNHFRVLNHEAAMGKSEKTFEALAWLGLNTNYKVVYVQSFANKVSEKNDGIQLQKTINKINKHAKKEVANYLSIKNADKHSTVIKDYNIICITHNKYIGYCQSNKKDLIDKADILIIDEFPNLYQKLEIGKKELRKLQGWTLDYEKGSKERENIEDITLYLKEYIENANKQYGKEMTIVNLHKRRNKSKINVLKKINRTIKDKDIKEVCDSCIELFSHGSVFEKGTLYTYNSNIRYKLAKENNIILDANGGFDERYKLNKNLFVLDRQSKVFDYSGSTITYYQIKTTKTETNKYIDIIKDVRDYIKGKTEYNKCLVVTDKDRDIKITEAQKELYEQLEGISFTYFGNFIGKNDWREYDTVWTVKTPYFRFYEYILMYMFYSGKELNGNTSCKVGNKKGKKYIVFQNQEFDRLKNSIVAGEIYQGAKRIARDGRDCNVNVLIDNPEIFNLVKKQFKGIQSAVKEDLNLRVKQTKAQKNKKIKLEKMEKVLSKYIESGVNKLEKVEFAKEVDVAPTNLSRELKKISKFLVDKSIAIGNGKDREYIIFKNNAA